MHIHRGIWISLFIALVCCPTLSQADALLSFKRDYHVQAESHSILGDHASQDIETIFNSQLSITVSSEFGAAASASTDGALYPTPPPGAPVSSGFLSSGGRVNGGGNGSSSALASIDFMPTDWLNLNLLASGF